MYIIAEIGFNHEGSMDVAAKMIQSAAESGANAVKFQTYKANDILMPYNANYEAIQCGEIDINQHIELYQIANDNKIEFISTPFNPRAVELLEKIGVSAYKVASMDCTNKYLLKYIAQTGKPIYISTGMATLNEIAETLHFLNEQMSTKITIMHCLSLYPADAQSLNLNIIPFLKQIFGVPVGYSDHYPGTKACIAAALVGAAVIETHFTLNSKKTGADHYHSAEPDDLKSLILDINLFSTMCGKKEAIFKRPDRKYAKEYRRGLYAASDLKKGHIMNELDFLCCRPFSGLSPEDIKWFNGKILNQDILAYQAMEKTFI